MPSIDFQNPANVKALIKDFELQINKENELVKALKSHILNELFEDNEKKLTSEDYEKALKSYFKNDEYQTHIIMNMIYDAFVYNNIVIMSPKEIKAYTISYLQQEQTYSYMIDIGDDQPIVATIYPDNREVKLELRREIDDAVEIAQFNQEGKDITS